MLLHQPIDYHAERRPSHGLPPILNWDYTTLMTRSHAVARLLLEPRSRQRIG